MGAQPDPLGKIEDPTVRRFVRAVVHVRRYLPFYVGGLLFSLTMLVVPVVDGGGGGTPSSLAGPGGGAGSAAGPAGAARTAGPVAAPVAARAASTTAGLASAPTFLDDGFAASADASGELAGGGATAAPIAAGRKGTAAAPDGIEAPDPDFGVPDEPEVPEPCTLQPPAPAPSVDPKRELTSGQNTIEGAARQDLPVDVASTAAPATDAVACSSPALPVETPSVPLPATPVAVDGGGPAGWLVDLVRQLDLRLFGLG